MVNENQPGPRAHQGTSSRDLLMGQINNAELWMALGQVYERKREYAMAADSYRHGSDLDSLDSDIAYSWARAALASGDYNGAKDAIQQLRSIDPLRVGPQLLDHPVMLKGRAEEAAMAKEKPQAKVRILQGPGFIPRRENVNTVPRQDPEKNAAPRQV